MSRIAVESFKIVCDGCGKDFEDGDFSIFGEGWDVEDGLMDSEWLTILNPDDMVEPERHYCSECWVYQVDADGEQMETEDGDLIRVPKAKVDTHKVSS